LFACPGLRVGYVLAPDETVACHIDARRPEWSVNALACAVVPHLVEHAALAEWSVAVRELRTHLVALLRTHGLETLPSEANFVLVPAAAGLRDHLARRAVLVRDTASFGRPGGVRVAVPDDAGLERLALALRDWEPA
jgi:threonine-phosphate decarboxylase